MAEAERGRDGVVVGLHFDEPGARYDGFLWEAANAGGDAVSLVWSWQQVDVRASEVERRSSETPGDTEIVEAAQLATQLGLEVLMLPFVRLDGSTRNRGAVVERFQDAAGPPIFLISLKAGGTGLNLTAADHVFLLDPWWNPAVEEQAADRAHRIGQDKPVFVYRLVTEDTVEERILELQDRKRALADAALGDANQAGGITRDELLALLA